MDLGPDARLRLSPQDEFTHPIEAARNFNESMYINCFDPRQQVGGWFRMGNRANEGYAEMTICLYLPGGPYGVALDPLRRRLWVTLPALNQLVELPAHGRPHVLRRFATVRQPDSVAVDEHTGRVFVTGLGAVSPLGNDAETLWTRLLAGTSGAGPITRFDSTNFGTRFAFAEMYRNRYWNDRNFDAVDRLIAIATEHDMDPATFATAWWSGRARWTRSAASSWDATSSAAAMSATASGTRRPRSARCTRWCITCSFNPVTNHPVFARRI